MQAAAGPATDAPPAAAGAGLAQPVAGARAGLGRAAGLGRPGAGGHGGGADLPGVSRRVQPLGGRSQQLAAAGQPGHELGPVLQPGAVDDRVGLDPVGEPHQRVVVCRGRYRRDRAQIDVAETVERRHFVTVGDRELGEHPRADGDDQDLHRKRIPGLSAANSVAATMSAVAPGFSRCPSPRSRASSSASGRL